MSGYIKLLWDRDEFPNSPFPAWKIECICTYTETGVAMGDDAESECWLTVYVTHAIDLQEVTKKLSELGIAVIDEDKNIKLHLSLHDQHGGDHFSYYPSSRYLAKYGGESTNSTNHHKHFGPVNQDKQTFKKVVEKLEPIFKYG